MNDVAVSTTIANAPKPGKSPWERGWKFDFSSLYNFFLASVMVPLPSSTGQQELQMMPADDPSGVVSDPDEVFAVRLGWDRGGFMHSTKVCMEGIPTRGPTSYRFVCPSDRKSTHFVYLK